MTVFDCPECDHQSTHWSPLTGAPRVFWHFFREHPTLMARSGNPLADEKGLTKEDFIEETEGDQ